MSSGLVLWLPLVHPIWLPNQRNHGPSGALGAEPSPPLTPQSLMTFPGGPFWFSPLKCPQPPPREARAAAWPLGPFALQGGARGAE